MDTKPKIICETPLIEIDGIFAKLECTNSCGSIKDRIAKYIIDESEKKNILKPGMTIIEATSGNTGISLSYYGIKKGYRVVIVMPEDMSEERKSIIKNLGAELVLCTAGNFIEAAAIRDKLAKEKGYFNPDQFSNPLNVECHCRTTGQEILRQMKKYGGQVDAFAAGVGTGGTLIGVAKALKKINPKVHIAAVEPSESAVMSGGSPNHHEIPGIGDGFIPAIVKGNKSDRILHDLIDEVIQISSKDAKDAAKHIEKNFGYCVGISSGANYLAAKKLSKTFKTVVTVFPDGYTKYISKGLGQSKKGRCCYEKDHLNVLTNQCNCC